MARSGSPNSTPRDANRVPLLVAASTSDGVTPVVLEADPVTHQLQVSSSGGGGGSDVQYTDGAAAVTHPVGTIPVFNNAGTITAVSAANPLPITADNKLASIAMSLLSYFGLRSNCCNAKIAIYSASQDKCMQCGKTVV